MLRPDSSGSVGSGWAAPGYAFRGPGGDHRGVTETPSTPATSTTAQVVGSAAARSEEHRRTSMSTRPRDMLISMTVIVGIVCLFLLIVPRPNQVQTRDIDVASAVLGATADLGFTPVNPEPGLSEGWTARAAGIEAGTTDGISTWQVTFTTPTGTYAGVQQAANATKAWVARQVTDGAAAGTEVVGGLTWTIRSRQDRGITSLVHRGDDGVTTVVTGTANSEQMDAFTAVVAQRLKKIAAAAAKAKKDNT